MAARSDKTKKTAAKRTAAKKAGSDSASPGRRSKGATSRTPKKTPVTRKRTATRTDKTRPTVADAEARPLRRSRLSPKDLEMFRDLLIGHRRRLHGDVTNMTDEALGRNTRDASGNLSAMPIHMADIGSDNFEQEFTLNLIENERQLLREIDEALARIDEGTYGMCLATGGPIAKARLKAKPWAKHCIEYARQLEKGLVPRE